MMNKKTPHLVQYQGSKRSLANKILEYFPSKINRLIEPFAGTGAISIAAANKGLANQFIINDLNRPLALLLELVVSQPDFVAEEYERVWNGQEQDSIEHYYKIREKFNKCNEPILFLYLLARCVKGAVRYNGEGLFNQSPDKRRNGTRPETMRKNIFNISALMKGKVSFYSKDYKELLSSSVKGDFIYMDPPYQGVCGERNSRYFAGINHKEFIEEIQKLNKKEVDFIISYDGKSGEKAYGETLPDNLNMKRININAGRSTQGTLLGKDDLTLESLYLSKNLVKKIEL